MIETISFHLWLRAARLATPSKDPERATKHMLQKEVADTILINPISYSRYERGVRVPHPIIRRQLFALFEAIPH